MSDSQRTREQAQARAQMLFKSTTQREETLRAEISKERAALDARTAKLKALRLAKEAADRAAGEEAATADLDKKAKQPAEKRRRKTAGKTINAS